MPLFSPINTVSLPLLVEFFNDEMRPECVYRFADDVRGCRVPSIASSRAFRQPHEARSRSDSHRHGGRQHAHCYVRRSHALTRSSLLADRDIRSPTSRRSTSVRGPDIDCGYENEESRPATEHHTGRNSQMQWGDRSCMRRRGGSPEQGREDCVGAGARSQQRLLIR